jgi:hypothetical protein
MTSAFDAALAALLADPNIGRDVVYTPQGGTPITVRAVLRRPDDVTSFGDARLWSETTRLDLCVGEVTNPRPGDRVRIDGEDFDIQGEPQRDSERLIWTITLAPA